ncbi:phosphatase PAP2 family protein [Microbacterium sp.]|uniref:phosphatase PAP2 family protein n=1 Tax=Microbacterium sp. TaxID=51671 RepID=UPI002622404A|nr:phosphatase PAP2 family protein [Microbacterium sp.]
MTRSARVWWGFGLLATAVLLGAFVSGAIGVDATAIDIWWNRQMAGWRSEATVGLAHVFNEIGGGWIATLLVPLLIAAALVIARRWRAAVFALATFVISAGLVQALKQVFGRARPEDMLVLSDYGSFPSGHTANAATIAAVVVLLFPAVWTLIVAAVWTVAMALSRTTLSVHWLSDTIGGALVGIAAALLVAAVLLPWVQQQTQPDGPVGTLE